MSGEYAVAEKLIDEAISSAEASNTMNPDSMSLALLSLIIRRLSQYRTRADIESCVDYDLDYVVEQDQVITRGC